YAEDRRFPDEAAAALDALAAYLREVVRVIVDAVPAPSPTLLEARRRLGLVANAADASFQRLLSEATAGPDGEEAIMTLLLYVRRINATLGAMASTRTIAPAAPHRAVLVELGDEVGAALEDLAEAVRKGRAPAPRPAVEELAA